MNMKSAPWRRPQGRIYRQLLSAAGTSPLADSLTLTPHTLRLFTLEVKKRPLDRESLDAVVHGIDEMGSAPAIEHEGPGCVELARLSAGTAPTGERFSVEGELLHAVIAKLANDNVAFSIECQAVGIAQLAGFAALFAPHVKELAVVAEDLNAVVARIGDPNVARGIDLKVLGPHELPRVRTMPAPLQ